MDLRCVVAPCSLRLLVTACRRYAGPGSKEETHGRRSGDPLRKDYFNTWSVSTKIAGTQTGRVLDTTILAETQPPIYDDRIYSYVQARDSYPPRFLPKIEKGNIMTSSKGRLLVDKVDVSRF
jgi:hypothetical protein